MKRTHLFFGAMACALSGAGVAVIAQDQPGEMSPDRMMEQWARAGAPSEAHRALEPFVGEWEGRGTMYMGPEPTEWVGEKKSEWILGGRFIRSESRVLKMMGKAADVQGLDYMGYNNITGVYQKAWMDSMSTAIMHETGEYDAQTRTFTMRGSQDNPATGAEIPTRSVITVTGPDEHTLELYSHAPNGEEVLLVRIDYTRK